MNERIKELALEARLGPALLLHHYGKVDALTDTEQEELEQLEKFAELIVAHATECVRDVLREEDSELTYTAAAQVQNRIKEFFGVEE